MNSRNVSERSVAHSYTFFVIIILCFCFLSCSHNKKGHSLIGSKQNDSVISNHQVPPKNTAAIRVRDSLRWAYELQCNKFFEQLEPFSRLEVVDDSLLSICNDILDTLIKNNCDDYTVFENGQSVSYYSLTGLYGKICQKSNSSMGVASFVSYLKKNRSSAEEQLSFSFESIFVERPVIVLQEITKDKNSREYLLDKLAWGFVNNRIYGAKDPYENEPYKAMTIHFDPPERVLTISNYREIFYAINPAIPALYNDNKEIIDEFLKKVEYLLEDQ